METPHASLPTILCIALFQRIVVADESVGRAGFKEPSGAEIETEFYSGRRGYLHGGSGVIVPLK